MKETTVLTFDSSSSSDIGVLEIDPNLNVDSDGNVKSSFQPKEKIYLSLHFDENKYVVNSFISSTGDIQLVGKQAGKRSIEQQFLQEATTDLQYIVYELINTVWYGPQGVISYSYNKITSTIVPCIVDLNFYIVSYIYVYIPDEYVNLENKDSFPVNIISNLEER